MRQVHALVFALLSISASWLGMTALHELGHVINAGLSGGKVTAVERPPRGLGHTTVSPNPHPQFVAWEGAFWGCLLPLAILPFTRRNEIWHWFTRFFAGVCLIANGAYIGLGGFVGDATGADDAHELMRQGARSWQLVLFGVIAVAIGLRILHRLGPRLGFAKAVKCAGFKAITVFFAAIASLLAMAVLLGQIG